MIGREMLRSEASSRMNAWAGKLPDLKQRHSAETRRESERVAQNRASETSMPARSLHRSFEPLAAITSLTFRSGVMKILLRTRSPSSCAKGHRRGLINPNLRGPVFPVRKARLSLFSNPTTGHGTAPAAHAR